MKGSLIAISLLALSTIHSSGSLFGSSSENITAERERRARAEEQLTAAQTELHQEHESTSKWQTISIVLGVGCPTLLIVGAILGASTRRQHEKE